MQDPSSAAGGIDGLLVMAAGVGGGGLLGGALWLMRRRPVAREAPIRRAPSPSSVGLEDDPIVAALARRSDAGHRDGRPILPGEDGPLT